MDVFFVPFVNVIMIALNLYWWAVLLYIVLEWLEHFNIVNRYNQFIYNTHTFLFRIVEPALLQLRRVLPNIGNIDISPLVLILLIVFFQGMIARLTLKFI